MRSVIYGILCIAAACNSTSRAQTPVMYGLPGSLYTQNFDGLPNSGSFTLTGKGPVNLGASPINGSNLSGWQFLMTGGSNTTAAFAVGTGSSTGNAVYSLGASGTTERALGTLSSSAGIYAIGLLFTNNTGFPLNSFTVNFTTEQWRKGGSGNKNTWSFRYKTGLLTGIDQTNMVDETNLDMGSVITTTGATSLNGNLPENQKATGFTVQGLHWKNGEQLLLRWDDADESGNDDVCALDNFSFSATLLSAAPTVATNPATNISSDSAILNGTVNDNFSATTVVFEYDTVNTFSNPTTLNAVPGNIAAGSGNTNVSATLPGLDPGKVYFFRIKANNAMGNLRGSVLNFTTTFILPVVTTTVATGVTTSTANLGGSISSSGGSTITEKGIVWSLSANPTLLNNKVIMGNGTGNFIQTITGLPQATIINVRSYATSMAGTTYGSNQAFTTQTSILSLAPAAASLTNTATVNFILKTAQNITGLNASNFLLSANGPVGAAITGISGSGNTYTLTVNTGSGDGELSLRLQNDSGILPALNNKPYPAAGSYTIDKTPPLILAIGIPDKPMKIGDTVAATIAVSSDTGSYKMVSGNINGFGLSGFTKKNDSSYSAKFLITSGGNDVDAAADIPLSLLLVDSIGNSSSLFQSPIIQSSDPIDANRPFITGLTIPANGIYKAGDTLDFIFRFNENIFVMATAGAATLSATVGTRVKSAVYAGGNESDSLVFRYVIQPGDTDKDGIKLGNSIMLNNTEIKDRIGNIASPAFSNIPSTKNIIIDGVAPTVSSVTVPAAAIYKTGDTLDFTVNYSKKIIVNSSVASPSLTISIGTGLKYALYIQGTGSTALLFRYIVEPDDRDKDGIKLVSPVNLYSATLKDEAGNNASLVLSNIGALSKVSINPVVAPAVTTTAPGAIGPNSASLGGNIINSGGAAITERGIVWSANTNPTLSNNRVSMGIGTGNFLQSVTGLPQGTILNTRAYAVNSAGAAYGNNITFTTQTSILSLNTVPPNRTHAATVNFSLKLAQNITGLTASNFTLTTNGVTGASITGISGSGNMYTVTVKTGSGDGQLGLSLINDSNVSPSINNHPYASTGFYTIDKTPPVIRSVNIPDKAMKTGDTIPVMISVLPDQDMYKLVTGNINGFILTGFTKKNDSSYTCRFIVSNGGNDVDAAANIPLSISLADSMENISSLFQSPIIQSSDPIDANRPFITSLTVPANGIYKAGDTLDFVCKINEKIFLTALGGTAGFSITVGTRARTAVYAAGNSSDSLLFRYIIQSGETDKDGIKMGNPVMLINAEIKDVAGNTASPVLNNPPVTKNIFVDGVSPVISSVTTPVPAVYKTGNVLDFVINYTKKVTVTFISEPPSFFLIIGTKQRSAEYVSGSGSTVLLFRYTVQADDMDKDGIKLLSALNLNAATIRDDAGNQASIALSNIGALSNIIINPVTAAVNAVMVPDAAVYRCKDTLEFRVGFTEKIFVTNGIPSLKLTIGTVSKYAFYQNGSGTNSLLFFYAIQPGDEDTNGIQISTNISLNNALIKDEQGNVVPLSLNTIPVTTGILVDAVPPAVKSVSVPAKKMYVERDTLDFVVYLTEQVNGMLNMDTPFIKLFIGNVLKKINYVNGYGNNTLLFRYIVQKGDLDKDGIKLDTSVSTLQNNITDIAGNPAVLVLKNMGALSGIKIDAVAPAFASSPVTDPVACENSAAFSINETLVVKDEEPGETLTWRVIAGADHGTVSKSIVSSLSNGSLITPNTILYKPANNYSGQDSLLVEVTDGVNTGRKKVTITIQPAVINNSIGPAQIVCTNTIPAMINGSVPSGGNGAYQLTWEQAAATDTTNFSTAVGTNNQQHYTPPPLTATTWFRRKVVSGECLNISSSSHVTVLKNGLWIGSTHSDWHNANNWCGGVVPDKTTDVWIYGNTLYDPVIKDTAWCNQLTIFDKAHVTVIGVLVMKGNISADPETIDATDGTLIYNGTIPQNIFAASFIDRSVKKLVINNTRPVSLQDPLCVTGSLLLNSGSLITNDYLTIKYIGSIGPSATGTAISGNTTVEHFIKGGKRAFRLLGHPFAMHTGLEMIKDSVDITGNNGSANGFRNTLTNQPSAFRYDPFAGNDSLGIDAGWTEFTSTNDRGENSWKEFSGIRLLIRGRPGQGLDGTPAGDGKNGTYLPNPVILSMSGPVHTGDQEVVLKKEKKTAYQVIANPYAASIDLSLVTRSKSIGQHYWVWNPLQAVNGGYSSVPFKNKYVLPPFGAFVVKLNDDLNNNLLFTENCKVNENAPDNFPLLNNDDNYFIELRLETDSIFWDRVLLFAIDSARSNVDKNDAEKFHNPDVNFYSISHDGKMLSIDTRPVNNETSIPLGLQTNAAGPFSIRVAKLSLPSSNTLMLHDRYLNRWIKLEKDSGYTFKVTADTATQGTERFEISSKKSPAIVPESTLMSKVTPVPATNKIIVSYQAPEKGNTHIRLLNLSGVALKNIALGYQKEGQVTIPVNDMPRGIYLVEVSCGDKINTQKMIKN